jgi:acyl-coenzyme A synthetase/AMP-(fatty) acid ligase
MIRTFLPYAPNDRVAVGDAGTRTAGDLYRDVAAAAGALAALPAGEVLVVCEDRYLFAVALLAAWRAGHVVVLPPNSQPDTIRALSSAPTVRALLHDRAGAQEGTHLATLLSGAASDEPTPLPAPDREVVVVTTSGSTGPSARFPKVMAQLLAEVEVHRELWKIGRDARILSSAPPHHIYGLLFGVLLPLDAGAAFVRDAPLHAEPVAATMERHRVTHFVSVPAQLRALAEAPAMPSVARVFSSGAPLPAATSRAVAERFGWRATEIFGSTETGGIAWRDVAGATWTLLAGVDATLGEEGRLRVDSPFLHPATPRPFSTGDRAALVPGGIEVLGRVDGVVKVGGKRVALREIEERALAAPGVRDAAALAVDVAGARGQEIWLAVAGAGVDAEQVRGALAPWLDPVTLPRRIRVVPALPRVETGKLERARLRALFEDEREGEPVVWRLEPDDETVEVDAQGREVRTLGVSVPANLGYFRGHFRGRPVLPGVVQLEALVLRQVRRLWPELRTPRRLVRLKFKRLILPGHRLRVILVRKQGEPTVQFDVQGPSGSYASGAVAFGAGVQAVRS